MKKWGLLANGTSRRWDIAVEESFDGHEWSLEIDGPQTYLIIQLESLGVIQEALSLLESGQGGDALLLGRFGSASVSLQWDNEDFARCFLILGSRAKSTLRLTFDPPDIKMLVEALRELMEDLPADAEMHAHSKDPKKKIRHS